MDAKKFFTQIALPLYQRFRIESNADELRWATIVALNQIPDYVARDRMPIETERPKLSKEAGSIRHNDDNLKKLGRIADALKHAQKIEKGQILARSESLRDDVFAINDIFAESDFLECESLILTVVRNRSCLSWKK